MKGPDVEAVLALLQEGRRDEARRMLVEVLDVSAETHRAGSAGSTRTVAEAADDAARAEDATATELAEATLRTLDHVQSGTIALRSGRVDELVAEARAAAEVMPAALPWVIFMVGSLFQAAYRFTGDTALREEALRICGRVADRWDRPDVAVQARALMGNIHMMRGALHRAMEHFDAALVLADAVERADAVESDAVRPTHRPPPWPTSSGATCCSSGTGWTRRRRRCCGPGS